MLPPVLRAVIFDLHGTLVDDEPMRLRLLQELAAEHGIGLDPSRAPSRFAGLDDRAALLQLWAEARRPLAPHDLRRLLAERSRRYRIALGQGVPLFPGAKALVLEAARRFPVGVVATSLRADAQAVLKEAGLFRKLSGLVTADDLPAAGAGHAACLEAINRIVARYRMEAIPPRRVLVFEDAEAGIHAAKRAGMKVAAVAHTQRIDRLQAADTHASRLIDYDLEGLEKELF